MNFLQSAASIEDIWQARSLRVHPLQGALTGLHAVALHDRWRVIIRVARDKITVQEVTNHYGD